ncbi:MAG TPA: SpoIIE family protein phosphatase [Terriglobales bacterium]|nr:SpoIIE family protein phosphatase [Terriglobales bacterium]
MTIRHRLSLSFAALILLFAASLWVYLWNAHLRSATMERLDRSLTRQVTLGRIQQNIDNLHKEVALLSNLATENEQTAVNSSARQLFNEKLDEVAQEIRQFKQLKVPEDGDAIDELESNYALLSQAWRAFYDYLGSEQTWSIANVAKADSLSYRMLRVTLPQMQSTETKRVENDKAEFVRVGKLTNRISAITFGIFVIVAVVVAIAISRSIVRGFAALQHGADLIGNMNLNHRIVLRTKDELGRFAQTFNAMAERLDISRRQLTQANSELARRNQEIRERQAHELAMAATIQQGLMAVRMPDLSFARIRAKNISCTQIGGDFYDVVLIDNGVAVIICDVSGKGMSAAIMASMLQGMMRAELAANVPLAEIVASANRFFTQRDVAGKYATICILAVEDSGRVEYVNCGHVAPVIVRNDGLERLGSNNAPVGLLEFMEYESRTIHLQPGEKIILVTDGVTEAANSEDEMFGDEKLEAAVVSDDAFESVFARVSGFCGDTPLNDDCTVVEIAFSGMGAEVPKKKIAMAAAS